MLLAASPQELSSTSHRPRLATTMKLRTLPPRAGCARPGVAGAGRPDVSSAGGVAAGLGVELTGDWLAALVAGGGVRPAQAVTARPAAATRTASRPADLAAGTCVMPIRRTQR